MLLFLPAALIIFIASAAVWSFLTHLKLRRRMPPGPIGWPLIGSMLKLPQILSDPRKFQQLMQNYGPVITLWNGSLPTILVSSHQIAHEVLVTKGSIFASRPHVPSLKILTSGFRTINAAPYGHHWRTARRNLVSGILSPRMMSNFAGIQEEAVDRLVLKLSSEARHSGGTVSISGNVRRSLLEILSFICFGRQLKCTELKQLDDLMKEATTMLRPNIGDLVPLLKPLVNSSSSSSKLKDFLVRQEQLLGRLISELEKDSPPYGCYVQTLLSLQDTSEDHLDLTVLVRELFIAGADTTTNCVEWTMANLINQPQVQKKVFDELAEKIGENKPVRVEDLPKLPYLDAVVKEALRRHPPVYVTAPHVSTEPATVAGYEIPLGSTVLVHLQSLNSDSEAWQEPEAFKPERFFDQPGALQNMMPFGAGRRICPGRYLGMLHVHLIIAKLVQAFEWRAEEGKEVDLSPKAGFTIGMQNPLKANLILLVSSCAGQMNSCGFNFPQEEDHENSKASMIFPSAASFAKSETYDTKESASFW